MNDEIVYVILGILIVSALLIVPLVLTIINLIWLARLSRRVNRALPPEAAPVPRPAPPKPAAVAIPIAARAVESAPALRPVAAPPLRSPKESLESRIGSGWLARIGMLAIVIGIAFFLKYAIDNAWLGEVARVLIGLVIGLAALVGGEWMARRTYARTGVALTGGGLAINYFSLTAAYSFYHLVPQLPALGFMILNTLIGVLLAVRYNSRTIATLGLLGGFLTPVLLSTGKNELVGLCTLMFILDAGFLLLAHFRDWKFLNLLAFAGTAALWGGWMEEFYTEAQFGITLALLTVFFIVFATLALYYNLLHRQRARWLDLLLLTLNSVSYYAVGAALVDDFNEYLTGAFTLAVAAVYLLLAVVSARRSGGDRWLVRFITGLALVYLTLVFPMQFDDAPVVLAWTIEGFVLLALGLNLRSWKLRAAAWLVLLIPLARLLAWGSAIKEVAGNPAFTLLWNSRFGLILAFVAALYGGRFLYRRWPERAHRTEARVLGVVVLLLANGMSLFALTCESADYFDWRLRSLPATREQEQWNREQNEIFSRQYQLRQKLDDPDATAAQRDVWQRQQDEDQARLAEYYTRSATVSEQYYRQSKRLRDAQGLSYSIIWGCYSLLMLVAGIGARSATLRLSAIVVFGITIFKVFLLDLAQLETIYRIVSFVGLGILLLAVSLLYTRFKAKINEFVLAEHKEDKPNA